ncbi:MAG TPA: crosslink repair DNA glycosylase YcaQ family protein [Vicinamibacterales bacterium]|nr:crosslink repair DNA glycosylase YcaQ family protein [Vicinamibacterales bacterium]
MNLDRLRRAAVAQTLFPPSTLQAALDALGFVQADPIRAPARAQDLTLRHRVAGYRSGDLERLYPQLDVHEDVFVNYGFVTSAVQKLMHPRGGPAPWTRARGRYVRGVLSFVRARGVVHPREVDEHFSHGTVTNYWGGSSSATTHLLDAMHYRGLLRVVGREAGIRIYAVHEHEAEPRDPAGRRSRLDALVDVLARSYAPLPGPTLSSLVRRLRYAVPQWSGELDATLQRARRRLARTRIDGVEWYWPAEPEGSTDAARDDQVRLLTPFDPIVWDRRRFELLWGWEYRFEAYTPAAKRRLGYYALPLLWRDHVIGWANVAVDDGTVQPDLGYIAARPPRDRGFRRALDEEVDRLRDFLGLGPGERRPAARASRRAGSIGAEA